jgi:predicted RND superfamily exporter protein
MDACRLAGYSEGIVIDMRLFGYRSKLRQLAVGSFGALAQAAITHPKRTLFMLALTTLLAAPGIGRLKLRTDGHALLAPNTPEALYDQALRRNFEIEDNIVVLVRSRHPEGIFNPATVQLVRDLTAELTHLPGINPSNVMSLATEPTFHFRPGTLVNQTLLEVPLTTKAQLDQLREDLRRIQLYTGTLLSADGNSTVILIGIPAGANRPRLFRRVEEIVARRVPQTRPIVAAKESGSAAGSAHISVGSSLSGAASEESESTASNEQDLNEIAVTGAPVAEALLGIHILEDLGVPRALLGASSRDRADDAWTMPTSLQGLRVLLARRIGLVPLAILVMMLLFYLSFRNVPAVLLPLPGVLATLLFVFGFMGWFGVPIYLTIAVMPVLLTATGVTNDIYIVSRYFTLLRQQLAVGKFNLLRETFDQMAGPVAITSLTTAIGFLSFGFSPLRPVRAFGMCAAIGVLFGLFYSFTGVPALLALLEPAWLPSGRGAAARKVEQTLLSVPCASDRVEVAANRAPPLGQDDLLAALPAWFVRLGQFVVRRRWWIASLMLVAVALTPLGLRRLVVQDSWIDGFDPTSEFRRTTEHVNAQLFGMHLLLVSFDAPKVLTATVPASAFSPGAIALPAGLTDTPAMVEGSSITICLTNAPGTGTTSNALWGSHIQLTLKGGASLTARIPPEDLPPAFWEAIAKAGMARLEIAAHTHVRPDVIRSIGDLGAFIRQRSLYAVGGVLGPLEYLTTSRFMVRPDDPEARRLPDDAAEIKLLWDYYRLARGRHHLHEVLDTNYWQSLTTVFLKDANFVDTARLMNDIRGYEREHLAPLGVKLGFAGDVALSQSLIHGIVTTQMQSLFWSLLGILLVTALLGGSWRWGLYCVLPSAVAVLIKFAVMGWAGIPLGVATSMFAAMTLGIGVNCAIQLLESHRQVRAAGAPASEALARALALTGPPALINTIAVSLGFAVLMLSQVPANARLGTLLVLGLVNCFVVSLLILPVMLHWSPLRDPYEARNALLRSKEL